jgi:hypothetical protein
MGVWQLLGNALAASGTTGITTRAIAEQRRSVETTRGLPYRESMVFMG